MREAEDDTLQQSITLLEANGAKASFVYPKSLGVMLAHLGARLDARRLLISFARKRQYASRTSQVTLIACPRTGKSGAVALPSRDQRIDTVNHDEIPKKFEQQDFAR